LGSLFIFRPGLLGCQLFFDGRVFLTARSLGRQLFFDGRVFGAARLFFSGRGFAPSLLQGRQIKSKITLSQLKSI
jgi:hypothetical protein